MKYYKLSLLSPIGGVFYVVCEDKKYYELLTNKEVLMFDSNYEKLIQDLLNNNCRLVGMYKTEISEEEVSKFLKFLTQSQKEEILEKIDITEKFIEHYKESLNIDKNKVKKMTKYEFLKKH